MTQDITGFVGLDVHKESIAIAVAEPGREAARFVGTVTSQLKQLLKGLAHLGRPEQLLVAYEAGPCGYVLARELIKRGYHCEVVAPAQIPRRAGDRIKTDRRDALSLARFLRAGELTAVVIPDPADEAVRDLCRAREDALRARHRARLQLKAMLLRHGHRYTGKSSWSRAHELFLSQVSLPYAAHQVAYSEYRLAVRDSHERVLRLTQAVREQVLLWRWQGVVQALMSLRGVDLIIATNIVAEIGDLGRFAHPRQLMSFLGLVPSEHSSGESRARGRITKTGNVHVRSLLIESAWCYRFPARLGVEISARQQGLPQKVCEISWRAQLRLCARYRALQRRGLHQNKICVSLARELCGFIWDIARSVPRPA